MTYFLLLISFSLSVGIYFFHRKYEESKKNIFYLKQKIREINKTDQYQQIKIITDDREIREILLELNTLLEAKYNNQKEYRLLETSMKQMISNISHDLKTPLTVILGYIETELLKEKDETETRQNLEIIYKKANELLVLINKFFELSKLESGDTKIEFTDVEISEFIRVTIGGLYKLIQEAGVEVDVNLPDEKIFIQTNEDILKRIINNLIMNALKYGAYGKYLGINIREEGEMLIVEIVDKGKGIEKKYQKKVFDRLFTLEDSRNREYQGSGLGLSITKKMVEQLGGKIELESIPYEKTIFRVYLRM